MAHQAESAGVGDDDPHLSDEREAQEEEEVIFTRNTRSRFRATNPEEEDSEGEGLSARDVAGNHGHSPAGDVGEECQETSRRKCLRLRRSQKA